MRSLWISGICGLIAVVTFVFSVPNVADALDHPTGYSLLYVLQLSVPNGVIVCVLLVLFGLVGVSNVGFAAATARVTYTFARDRGLPFSDWTSKVLCALASDIVDELLTSRQLSKGRMPVNAVFLTAAISIILSLLNLGSTTAFYAIVRLYIHPNEKYQLQS
jgi:choline transport protein